MSFFTQPPTMIPLIHDESKQLLSGTTSSTNIAAPTNQLNSNTNNCISKNIINSTPNTVNNENDCLIKNKTSPKPHTKNDSQTSAERIVKHQNSNEDQTNIRENTNKSNFCENSEKASSTPNSSASVPRIEYVVHL